MKIVYCLIFLIERAISRAVDKEKVEFCRNIECEQLSNKSTCGLRSEGDGFRLRLFENECELLRYGCRVKDEDEHGLTFRVSEENRSLADEDIMCLRVYPHPSRKIDFPKPYGIINLNYCVQTFTSTRRQSDAFGKIYQETLNDISEHPCSMLKCAHMSANYLCGLRQDGPGFKIRLFFNECELLKFNCENKVDFYPTNMRECKGIHRPKEPFITLSQSANEIRDTFKITENKTSESTTETEDASPEVEEDSHLNVTELANKENLPQNTLEGINDNEVDNDVSIMSGDDTSATSTLTDSTVPYETDLPIDDGDFSLDTISTSTDNLKYINNVPVPQNLIILDGGMVNFNGDINETMDNFFAATHVFDLPVKEVTKEAEILNESLRRMHMPIVGPKTVFKPWIVKPKNVLNLTEDMYHLPTLSSCYHKCPTVCPDTYTPVCGVPGIVAREPSLMFKNHCFMDAAQCKMRWDDKSATAQSSTYIESSFMICLGDSMNGLSRFLPLVKTLQHMGRLKRKGKFHYKLRNMRFISQYLAREPRLMG